MIEQQISSKANRYLILVISLVGILSLFILATSLSNLHFKPGQEIRSMAEDSDLIPPHKLPEAGWLWILCISTLLAMVPIGLVLLVISPETRKLFKERLKSLMVWMIFLIIVRIILAQTTQEEFPLGALELPAATPVVFESPLSMNIESGSADAYIPPVLPDWLGYLIGFILVMMAGIIGYWFFEKNRTQEDKLAEIALKALGEISDGRQWEDAVIECYAQMNLEVSRHRSLDREISMTPGEFVHQLARIGLPPGPIERLTHLFERARYGTKRSNPEAVSDAVQCLKAIIQALKELE